MYFVERFIIENKIRMKKIIFNYILRNFKIEIELARKLLST